MIAFLLNDEIHRIENLDPNTTVLNYLRLNLKRCGTKEGCASGDCGACTVAVGELEGDHIRYRNINACIALLPSLHGKQLVTVEDLKQGEQLHPVQQAMVDCHGSQCGFCTPGFVMSMFTLRKNKASPTREEVQEYLAGNLCRCTVYRPIIDAAVKMYEAPKQDQFSTQQAACIEQLKMIKQQSNISLQGNGNRYYAPTSSAELATLLLQYPDARLLAGGTDLSLEITQMLKEIAVLIYVGNVVEMAVVEETESSYKIGAAVPFSDCRQLIETDYPDFKELFERLGSMPIRNAGTFGGNIGNASPIADTPPGLIVVGAKVHLRRGDTQRVISVEDYFIDYKVTAQQESEFIEFVEIPKARPEYQFKMYKISKRIDDDIAAACAAFYLKIENGVVSDARIAFGGLAGIPKRASHCEAELSGKIWNESSLELAMKALDSDFKPLSDVRASAAYRMQVSKNLLHKCYLELIDCVENTRVTRYARNA